MLQNSSHVLSWLPGNLSTDANLSALFTRAHFSTKHVLLWLQIVLLCLSKFLCILGVFLILCFLVYSERNLNCETQNYFSAMHFSQDLCKLFFTNLHLWTSANDWLCLTLIHSSFYSGFLLQVKFSFGLLLK